MTASNTQWSVVSKNVFCFALSAMLFALCAFADAQQPTKIPRIGFQLDNPASAIAARIEG
jgi:hypothetical protein